jgi:hypothetical protein
VLDVSSAQYLRSFRIGVFEYAPDLIGPLANYRTLSLSKFPEAAESLEERAVLAKILRFPRPEHLIILSSLEGF